MTVTVNIHEAKTHLSRVLQRVMSGEELIIAKSGRSVARLSPIVERPATRVPGIDAGKAMIGDDFDDPLPEFEV